MTTPHPPRLLPSILQGLQPAEVVVSADEDLQKNREVTLSFKLGLRGDDVDTMDSEVMGAGTRDETLIGLVLAWYGSRKV